VWAISGTYGAFTPLMYLPARVWSQQNQDSVFRMGVLHILAGHSGPETAADARTHFGIFSPQVWKLFPRNQTIHLSFWDYNDVAPGYFAAAELAARDQKVGIISIEVARPDFPVADRNTFADTRPAGRRQGLLCDSRFRSRAPHGYVMSQGSSSTVNLVSVLPQAGGRRHQREGHRGDQRGTLRPPARGLSPLRAAPQALLRPDDRLYGHPPHVAAANVGPLTDEYSLTSDWGDQWLTGGLEPDVITEAHFDPKSIQNGILRFAKDHDRRIARQRDALK
jgi:transketolase